MALLGGVALWVPMVIMALNPSLDKSLTTTGAAVFIFAVAIALLSKRLRRMYSELRLRMQRSWWFLLGLGIVVSETDEAMGWKASVRCREELQVGYINASRVIE